MAFANEYTITYADAQSRTNIIYLDLQGGAGPATALNDGTAKPAEDPVTLRFGGNNDDEYRTLNPTELTIRLKVGATTVFDNIAANPGTFTWRVRWNRSGSEIWRGYLITDEIEQPFDLPSILTLRAVCGLKELDGIEWTAAATEDSFVDHIADILNGLPEHDQDIRFFANWHAYNGGTATGSDDNSYSRYTCNSDAFNDPLNADTKPVSSVALEQLVGVFGGKLYFGDGKWRLFQRDALAGSYSPDNRADSTGTITTGVETISAYSLSDSEVYKGAVRSNAPAYYKTQIGYNHYPIENGFLNNGDFSKWTGGVPDNWTEFGGSGNLTQQTRYIADGERGSAIDGEFNYLEIADVAHSGSNYGTDAVDNATVGVYQETAFDVQNTSHKLNLSFWARVIGGTNISISFFYAIWINTGTTDYYWDAVNNAWTAGTLGSAEGKMRRGADNNGRKFTIETSTLPATGAIRVYLYNPVDYGNRITSIYYSDVRLGYETGDRSERVQTVGIATNNNQTGGLVRPSATYFVGQGPTLVHTGSIKYSTALAANWKAGTYATSEASSGLTLERLHAQEILDQRGAPVRRLRLTFQPSSGSYWPHQSLSYESKNFSCVSLSYSSRWDRYTGEWLAVESAGLSPTYDEEFSDDDIRLPDFTKPIDETIRRGIPTFTVAGGMPTDFTIGVRGGRHSVAFPRSSTLGTDYSSALADNFLTGTLELAADALIKSVGGASTKWDGTIDSGTGLIDDPGENGFVITGYGQAVFNDLIVRGSINAGDKVYIGKDVGDLDYTTGPYEATTGEHGIWMNEENYWILDENNADTIEFRVGDYSAGQYIDWDGSNIQMLASGATSKIQFTSGNNVTKIENGLLSIVNATSNHSFTVVGGALVLKTSGNSGAWSGTGYVGSDAVDASFRTSTTGNLTIGVTSGSLIFDGGTDELTWPAADGLPNQVLKTDGSGNLGWVTPSSGVTTFVALTDTPANYTSANSYFVKVNAGATGLEFVADPGYLDSSDIGVSVQGYSSVLTSLAGLADPGADRMVIWNNTINQFQFITLDNANLSNGAGYYDSGDLGVNVQAYGIHLDQISSLGQVTGADRIMVSTGVGAWAYESGATARASLGLVIGTDVQAYDADLASIAALVDPNADRLLGWVDGAGNYGYYSVSGSGIGIGSNTIALSSNLQSLAALSDPNDDRLVAWDDSAGAIAYMDLGAGLSTSGATLITSVRIDSGEMQTDAISGISATSRTLSTYMPIRIAGSLYWIELHT